MLFEDYRWILHVAGTVINSIQLNHACCMLYKATCLFIPGLSGGSGFRRDSDEKPFRSVEFSKETGRPWIGKFVGSDLLSS